MIRNTIIINGINGEHPLAPTLDVTPMVFNVGEEGMVSGNISVSVASQEQEWSYEVSHDWLRIFNASLVGNDSTIRLQVDPQPQGEQPPRQGSVTFRSDTCADKVVTVNQVARAG